jgi:hypothetical protein
MDQNGPGASWSSIWQKSLRLMELWLVNKLNKLQVACISVSIATCKKG